MDVRKKLKKLIQDTEKRLLEIRREKADQKKTKVRFKDTLKGW
jgi:hypothetical protein